MYKSKDFKEMIIVNSKNKYQGKVSKILFDINEKKLIGFKINFMFSYHKNNFASTLNIKNITNKIYVSKLTRIKINEDNFIINSEIYDKDGTLMGNISEVLVDENNYNIKAFIVTPGILEKFILGKVIVLASDVYKSGNYIMCKGKSSIKFFSMIHEETRL